MKLHAGTWFTSRCSVTSSNCVGISDLGDVTAVRDTKRRLGFPVSEWDAFIRDVRRGDQGENSASCLPKRPMGFYDPDD
ncbi:DUF397 domain-containing protein [Nocardiopsis sp. CT-R113]|uniref:DUF397 domain-containing protein n=1 Tax=Nocardiopsis codii TaxID=3065942 RepID=A0ABU7K746_9ACTN|nr:DUF397 domain-containing protein [Nocardiopsis sp. CT-R113]MEE2038070.1 DUF397 domain-containing protein [Nocardiopsis sp. CT-R113]